MFALSSCTKLEDINKNPNDADDVPPSLLLPSIQDAIAFNQGGDVERFVSLFTQHIHGASRQFVVFDQYSFTEDDVDNLWRFNLYGGPLNDLHILMQKADAEGYTTYGAVARILMAYGLGITTDLWGDIPYSEAFRLSDNIQPKFDTQQEIYTTIQTLLDEAIIALDAGDVSPIQPGSDDLMYGGDAAGWRKFAVGLKARFHLHLTKVDANAATKALDALSMGGLESNADNAQFVFGTTETSSNPWYQYIQERDDISYTGFLLDTMAALNDPRLDKYIGSDGYPTAAIAGISAPVTFFTYAEQKFIEAEARQRTGDDAGAQAAFRDAIRASMSQWGVNPGDAAIYILANGDLSGSTEQRIAQIVFQKYLANFLKLEAFNDWRRTNVPALQPNPGAVLTEIPRRFVYPQSERQYNPQNCPQNSSMLIPRLWWDP